MPRDALALNRTDPRAFEYFFAQSTSDIVEGRYASELKFEAALRLAALHITQYCLSKENLKVSLKSVEYVLYFHLFMFWFETIICDNVFYFGAGKVRV